MDKSNFKELPVEMLDLISGGTLPDGWQSQADSMAPMLKKMYPNATYEEALVILKGYVTDPDDYAAIAEYMKKYF